MDVTLSHKLKCSVQIKIRSTDDELQVLRIVAFRIYTSKLIVFVVIDVKRYGGYYLDLAIGYQTPKGCPLWVMTYRHEIGHLEELDAALYAF